MERDIVGGISTLIVAAFFVAGMGGSELARAEPRYARIARIVAGMGYAGHAASALIPLTRATEIVFFVVAMTGALVWIAWAWRYNNRDTWRGGRARID